MLIVVLAIAAGGVTWAIVRGGGTSAHVPPTVSAIDPIGLSAQGLSALAKAQIGQPIYWAGKEAGFQYELRRNPNGNVYIRYLPKNVAAGTPSAKYMTVATYPFPGAYNALKKIKGSTPFSVPGGGVGIVDAKSARSIHIAFPNVDFQIELFDPSPAKALALAKSGRIAPVR